MHARAITRRKIKEILTERFGFTKFIASSNMEGIRFAIKEPTSRHPYWTISTVGMALRVMQQPSQVDPRKFRRAEVMISLPKGWKIPYTETGELDVETSQFWPLGILWGVFRMVKRLRMAIRPDTIQPIPALLVPSGRFNAVLITETQRSARGTWYVSVGEDTDINFYHLVFLLARECEAIQCNGIGRIKGYLPENAFVFRPMRQSAVTHPQRTICVATQRRVQHRKTDSGPVVYVPVIAYLWQWVISHYALNAQWYQQHWGLAQAVQDGRVEVLWEALSQRLDKGLNLADCEPWARAFFTWYFQRVQENEKTHYDEDLMRLKKDYLGCALERLKDRTLPWREDIRAKIWTMVTGRLQEFFTKNYTFEKPLHLTEELSRAKAQTYCMVSYNLWLVGGVVGLAYRAPLSERVLGEADSGWRFFLGDEAFRNDSTMPQRFMVMPLADYLVAHGGLLRIRDAQPGSWWVHTYRLHYEKLAERVSPPQRLATSDFDLWTYTEGNPYV